MRAIAGALSMNPRNFGRSLDAKNPTAKFLRSFAKEVGAAPTLVRALISPTELTPDDERAIRQSLADEILVYRAALFSDATGAHADATSALASVPPSRRREILAAFALTRDGLNERFGKFEKDLFSGRDLALLLSPALLTLYSGLKRSGSAFSFTPYLNVRRTQNAREATAAYLWLRFALPMSARETEAIEDIVKRHVPHLDRIRLSINPQLEAAIAAFYEEADRV